MAFRATGLSNSRLSSRYVSLALMCANCSALNFSAAAAVKRQKDRCCHSPQVHQLIILLHLTTNLAYSHINPCHSGPLARGTAYRGTILTSIHTFSHINPCHSRPLARGTTLRGSSSVGATPKSANHATGIRSTSPLNTNCDRPGTAAVPK